MRKGKVFLSWSEIISHWRSCSVRDARIGNWRKIGRINEWQDQSLVPSNVWKIISSQNLLLWLVDQLHRETAKISLILKTPAEAGLVKSGDKKWCSTAVLQWWSCFILIVCLFRPNVVCTVLVCHERVFLFCILCTNLCLLFHDNYKNNHVSCVYPEI